MKKTQFRVIPQQPIQPGQPIPVVTVRKETAQERFARLKRTADATGRRFVYVYLEDEKNRQQGNQR